MAKRNPYAVTITVLQIIGKVLLVILGLGGASLLFALGYSLWGWWAILWVPLCFAGYVVGIILLIAIVVSIDTGFESVRRMFRNKQHEWDRRNR